MSGLVQYKQLFDLSQQCNTQYLKFGVTTFESDQYISIRDKDANGNEQLTIVEPSNNWAVNKKPNKSESVLMHPAENIIALKAPGQGGNTVVQIFNMANRQKLKDLSFSERIVHWKWVNLNKLAIVTANSVYHTDITNSNETYKKIFDRFGTLAQQGVNIIGYELNPEQKWAALIGISTPDQGKTILGHIQLFLIESGKQQILEAHSATFGQAYLHNATHKSEIFAYYESKQGQQTQIIVSELNPPPQGFQKMKKMVPLRLDNAGDFPVIMKVLESCGLLVVITKFGFLYVFELTTLSILYQDRISQSPIFVGCKDSNQGGVYAINKQGGVILTRVNINGLVNAISSNPNIPNGQSLSFQLAQRYKLPGCENMFKEQFQRLFQQGDFKGAAQVVAQSAGNSLRNSQTIQMFKNANHQPGQQHPIIIYFQTLTENSSLNEEESIVLAQPALEQGKTQILEKYMDNNKITCSEKLGDMVKPVNIQLGIKIYKKAGAHSKVGYAMIESGDVNGGQAYLGQHNISNFDPSQIIRQTLQNQQFDNALSMAKNFYNQNKNMNVHQIAQIFQEFGRFRELTAFLVACMTENRPEDGPWQTQVLEYNLMSAPQVAEAVLQSENWKQYDKQKIGALCEQKQLFQLALQNYVNLADIKRCILNTHAIKPDWIINYMGKLEPEWCLECCTDMVRHNRQNVQIVVNIFQQQGERLGLDKCVKVFESVGAFDGIFYFLGAVVNSIQDKDVFFKYIEAATKCNQMPVLENIIKEKQDMYDPIRVKNFLKEMKLGDPKALIFVCDIFGYIEELTEYLYKNDFNKYIEIYLFKVNQASTPVVLGTLIDLECDENYIKQILYNIRGNCPIDPLIEEFSKRNKLRVLENWLDSRVAEGNQLPSVHNSLAKIKIDTNQDPENFLMTNQYYDPKEIGRFCEDRDPHLAVVAYKRSWGTCNEELIRVTNKNALFRLQARYLVELKDMEVWATVLDENNEFRQQVIEQVVSVALPESKSVDEVSTTVQAFVAADLPSALISLLEKIVLHNSEFGQYTKLQNLLIITAIKSDKSKVMDYINRLDNFNGETIAKVALGEEYQLYEEAHVIYKKKEMYTEAMDVLINYIQDIPRAAEFAEKYQLGEVWSKLGLSYLNNFQIIPAINAFIKAKDHTQYMNVIQQAENEQQWEKLIEFILMARQQTKDANLDNALAYAYARNDQLTDLESFVNGGNSLDAQKVGEKMYNSGLFEGAKILFVSIKNNAKIASCLVRLKQFQQAIDSAKKANTPKTWKEVCRACVEAGEYRLSAVAGMNLIIHPDHLEDVIQHYEEWGVPNEMISLLETGMSLDRAHVGIYTELGVLYAKYKPEKLTEHIKGYFQKLNVSKLLRICERYGLWKDSVYLYTNYDEFDNAVNIMIEHSPIAFNHEQFCTLIAKANSSDLYYKAINFYIEEQPMQLNDLLKHLTTKLDLTRTVQVMRKTGYIALITDFLKSVQMQNIKEVNEALNEIYFELEDYEALRQSVTEFESFDQVALAKQCEKHQLQEFRRIGAFLYRRARQFEFSIELSKIDKEYRDAIDTAQESGKSELVENLLKFFVQQGEKEFVTVTLYTCYDLLKPDLVMELAWRFGLMEFCMPYFIQITQSLSSRLEHVQRKADEREKEAEKQAKDKTNKPLDIVQDMFTNPNGMGMLPPPNYSQQPGMGGGFNSMGQGQGLGGSGYMGSNNNMGGQFQGFGSQY